MYPIQKINFSLSNGVKSSFHNRTYRVGAHIHQMMELVYVIDGEMLVKTRGKRTIAKSGDLILLHPYQPHGFYTEEGKTVKLWMLLFSNTFVMDVIDNSISYKDYQNAVFTPSDILRAFVESKMFDTEEKLIELNARNTLSLKALLYPILDEYKRKVPVVIFPNKNFSNLINSLLLFVKNNFIEDITIENCAQAIGYSKSHISHSLKQTLGATFLELRNSLRIDYAKGLLTKNDMSVYQVALECGFNCQKSFERAFKKSLKITPREYRDRSKNSQKATNS